MEIRVNTINYLPKVSVIIPVWNVAPYLQEALDSVIHQTYTKLEIIIVDDGSTDGSGAICDKYKNDPRVTVFHQENKGLSVARNVGLDLMTGDAIAFLDSDDVYDLDFIKLMVDTINRDKTDMVVCKYSIIYSSELEIADAPKEQPIIVEGVYDRYNAIQALFNGELNVNVWNKLYKNDLWSSIRFSEGHVFEDNEVAYRIMALCNNISVIDNVLYRHLKRIGSITTTQSISNFRDQFLACSRVEGFIRANFPDLFSEQQLKDVRCSYVIGMISTYIHTSDGNSDWQMYREELRTSIIARGTEIELRKTLVKIACLIIRVCPWILKPLYSLYNPLRRIVLNATGK